jgi:hypothetical protein
MLGSSKLGASLRNRLAAPKTLIIGVAASVAIGIVLVIFAASKGTPVEPLIQLFGISIVLGLCVILFAIFFIYLLPSFHRDMHFKSLRNASFYGIGLALLFTIMAITELFQDLYLFFISYSIGLVLGVVVGQASIGYFNDRITDGRIIFKRPSDLAIRKYWRAYLLMICAFASCFLLPEILPKKSTRLCALSGLFLGLMLYNLVWVMLYEKRHHVRLTIIYEESHSEA